MCGRYTLSNVEALKAAITALLGVSPEDFSPRYNVAPTQAVPVVVGAQADPDNGLGEPDEHRAPGPHLVKMHWGTQWLDGKGKAQLGLNARSEKANFTRYRHALQERRCLIPANGFFEWDRSAKPPTPYLFSVSSWPAFWMAGVWEEATDEHVAGFLVLTTGPNALVAPIHDWMPAILGDAAARQWLKPGAITPARAKELCASYPAGEMSAKIVSRVINNARNDTNECIEPFMEVKSTGKCPDELF